MWLLGEMAALEAKTVVARVLEGLFAQAAPGAGGGMGSTLVLVLIMVGIFYLLLWRPQAKQAKEHRSMLTSLKKGDAVVTNGGIVGRIHQVGEKSLVLEAGRDVKLRVLLSAISGKAPEGLLDEPEKSEVKAEPKGK